MSIKLLRAIALILCLSCALISCEMNDEDTSSTANVSKDISVEISTPSENSVIDITSEDSSAEESSDIPVESSEESSEEASEPVEESSEEVSDPEPDYVKKMDDEMADLFLLTMGDFPMPDETSTVLYNWYFTQRDTIQQTYHAYGNLNGYTLFMVNDAGLHDLAIAVYRAGDYVFKANCHGYPSLVFLYLYRDNEFITFEDAYEQGLFDPKDAYELINNNPPPKYCRFAKPSAEKVED